jgi:hypothetical protein
VEMQQLFKRYFFLLHVFLCLFSSN